MVTYYRAKTIPRKRFRKGDELKEHLDKTDKALRDGRVKDAIRLVLQWKGQVSIQYLQYAVWIRPKLMYKALEEMVTDGEIEEDKW